MKKSIAYGLVAVIALFWGLSFIAMTELLKYIDELQVLALRWTLAAILFGGMIAAGKIRLRLHKRSVGALLLTGIMEPGIYSVFEIFGLSNTSASVSSIFIATIPCMTLIMGALFFHMRANRRSVLSILVAFAGVVIFTVFSPTFSISGDLKGYVFMIVAVVAGAFYAFASKAASQDYGPLEVTAVMAFVGAIEFNLICLFKGYGISTYVDGLSSLRMIVCIVFLGVCCSSLCYIAFNKIISVVDSATANNLIGNTVTVVGVVAGVLINGDAAGIYTVIGVAMTLLGVWMSSGNLEDMETEESVLTETE